MARITVEDCIDKFESRFELVLVASNRARKLHSGDSPTVEKDNDKNTVIALREIADETISIDQMKDNLIEEYQTVSMQTEEDLSIEHSEVENQSKELSENDSEEVSENDTEELSENDTEALSENSEDLKEIEESTLDSESSESVNDNVDNPNNFEQENNSTEVVEEDTN